MTEAELEELLARFGEDWLAVEGHVEVIAVAIGLPPIRAGSIFRAFSDGVRNALELRHPNLAIQMDQVRGLLVEPDRLYGDIRRNFSAIMPRPLANIRLVDRNGGFEIGPNAG